MIRRIRARLDARALRRAKAVFERRGWKDAPGYAPVVADTVTQLGYRSRALRLDRGYR